MSWSAAEISALAAKAARGGGAPPGQAERFGQVAALHLMLGRDAGLLDAALAALPEGPILGHALAVDSALDAIARGETGAVEVVPQDDLLASYVQALPFEAALAGAVLAVDFETPRGRIDPRRITGCEALVACMTELAAETFVPESEASRRAGAGAGLTDND